jgi:Ca2+-binding EF-hand superfamily protein
MFINQNFSACSKFLNLNAVSFAKINRIVVMSRLAIGLALLFSFAEVIVAGPRDNQNNNEEVTKSQPSDNSKSSTEAVGVNMDDNIRLRRTLDEYSRTVDPAHVQIEERRRVMHQRIQERFSQADRDNDGGISLEEAYDSMPQLARHFGAVDLNSDHMITLEELEALQAKIAERQRMATLKVDTLEADNPKAKNKQGASGNRKSAL